MEIGNKFRRFFQGFHKREEPTKLSEQEIIQEAPDIPEEASQPNTGSGQPIFDVRTLLSVPESYIYNPFPTGLEIPVKESPREVVLVVVEKGSLREHPVPMMPQ